ncbi:MAG TPA: glutamate racemase [Candidatus Coprenecus stercoravium]|uniref:Glutamate racemase n=1 Tax=Candidatus Coprenecus stercoravium TaxID=2840735 RepID=A0A9D2KAC5_9BACT|nr:glutamate racemase [Candidatus Coprenecus stercoravium]
MVGVYDSGVGGLSVWKELVALMPGQDYVYVADSAHCPYGEKSPEYIVGRADAVTRLLLEKGADAVVVACNTATAAAISYLRASYQVPFIGMEPAVKPAALASVSGVVGVLATANTFKGSLYRDTVMKYASGITVIEKVGRGLVEAVEKGEIPRGLVRRYVDEMVGEGADVIVLGCTHYPFLEDEISRCAGPSVRIVNPAPAVAAQTMRVLDGHVSGTGTRKFYSTGDTAVLRSLATGIDPSLSPADFETISI